MATFILRKGTLEGKGWLRTVLTPSPGHRISAVIHRQGPDPSLPRWAEVFPSKITIIDIPENKGPAKSSLTHSLVFAITP